MIFLVFYTFSINKILRINTFLQPKIAKDMN